MHRRSIRVWRLQLVILTQVEQLLRPRETLGHQRRVDAVIDKVRETDLATGSDELVGDGLALGGAGGAGAGEVYDGDVRRGSGHVRRDNAGKKYNVEE